MSQMTAPVAATTSKAGTGQATVEPRGGGERLGPNLVEVATAPRVGD